MNGINNMQSFAKKEKSKGVVIFATNTKETDYIGIAEQNARLVKHWLGLPTTIISPTTTGNNTRFSSELNKFVSWNNFGRFEAYSASPYDDTIILDADYLIFDNTLLKLFETNFDYLLFNKNHYVNIEQQPSVMGPHSLPYVWATAVLFRKTAKTEMFFELVAKINRNYDYYRLLYNIQEGNFRNDYAFAIANYILNGYNINLPFAPWPIHTFTGNINSIEFNNKNIIVKNSERAYILPHQNLHLINKSWLSSPALKELVDQCLDIMPNKVF